MTACRNCGVTLQGRYCHACGQKAVASEVSVHDLMHEGIEEFAHVDGKIGRTLRLLVTKPGALTGEFLAGRRARYISPLRLYLTCSLLFFALAAVAPPNPNAKFNVTRSADDQDDPKDVEQDARKLERLKEGYQDMRERINHYAPRSMFVLMPVFGLFTWALYARAQRFYIPHLYYAVHFHAFVFLVLAFGEACSFAGRIGNGVGSLAGLAIFPYHYASLRRVFGGTRWQTAWKGTLIAVTYLLIIAGILVALLVLMVKSALASS
jgi:Protein of unknown function (DUF3667)